MRLNLALFLVMLITTLRADPARVAKDVRAWRTNHEREILAEFAQLLSIPNLANDTPNIRRNAEAIRKMCEKRGLVAKLATIEGAPPVVVADFVLRNAKRTIAFYAHYDGQPVDVSQWKSEPWKPVMRDNAATMLIGATRKPSMRNGAFSPARPAMTRLRSSPCSRRSTLSAVSRCSRR